MALACDDLMLSPSLIYLGHPDNSHVV